jgi:hypothetical protein
LLGLVMPTATPPDQVEVVPGRVVAHPTIGDIGTSEKLAVNANGGGDSFAATGNLAALIAITVDGGAGSDVASAGRAPTSSTAATATTSRSKASAATR